MLGSESGRRRFVRGRRRLTPEEWYLASVRAAGIFGMMPTDPHPTNHDDGVSTDENGTISGGISSNTTPSGQNTASMGLGWASTGGYPESKASPVIMERCTYLVRALANETSEAFYDVTIEVEDKKFYAHRAILAAQSTVFKAMFMANMRESTSGIVQLSDISPTAFSVVLRHLYGSSLEDASCAVLMDVWEFAHRMDITSLERATAEVLFNGMLNDLSLLRKKWAVTHASKLTWLQPSASVDGDVTTRGTVRTGTTATVPASSGVSGLSSTASTPGGFGGLTLNTSTTNTNAFSSSIGVVGSGTNAHNSPAVTAPLFGTSPPDTARTSQTTSTPAPASTPTVQLPLRTLPVTFLAAGLAKVLNSPEFCALPYALLERLLKSSTIAVPEIQLFIRAMGTLFFPAVCLRFCYPYALTFLLVVLTMVVRLRIVLELYVA